MITLFLILGFALSNRLWGSALFKGNKEAAVILAGIVTAFASYMADYTPLTSLIHGLMAALAYWFGRIWALSIYFCCFNPTLLNVQNINTGGIRWINNICNELISNVTSQDNNKKRLWGTIGMTLRGLYFYLLIACFAYLNPWAVLIAFGVVLTGPIYALQYYQPAKWWMRQWQVPAAELLEGALLGLLISLTI